MEFLAFIICLVAIALWIMVANEFGTIAELKGYDKMRYALFTVFFSVAGMLMVIALPKKEASDSPKKIAEELPEL